jgi:osmoprotectant transport system substrate-binding protein
MKRIYLAIMAVIALMSLAACGSSGSSAQANSPSPSFNTSTSGSATATSSSLPKAPGSVTMGSGGIPEAILLGNIYGDAMSAKGVKVTKHLGIGERPVYMAAMKDGSISAIPEYSGSIVSYLNPKTTTKTPADVYAELQKLAATNGFAVTKFAAAQDSDTITVTQATAAKYHLKSIADLKSVASKLTFGAPAQFKTRADGIPALAKDYGVTFGRFVVTDAGGTVTVNSLKNGVVDAADVYSTDSLFSQKVLTQPMEDACNAVSAKLDTKTLAALDKKVADGADSDSVAKAWLKQEGLD